MPIHLNHTVRQGTTQHSIFIVAHDTNGVPVRGVTAESNGIHAGFVRIGEPPTEIALTQGRTGAWVSGGFVEVDAALMPGVYQLDVPNEVTAAGATEALLTVQCTAATFDPVEFTLVAYDPQDARSLGLVQLEQRTRHDFLRRALPRFTEVESGI